METSARGGEPAEQVYRRLGFREWGRLPGGLQQSWGKVRAFDEVYFYLHVGAAHAHSVVHPASPCRFGRQAGDMQHRLAGRIT